MRNTRSRNCMAIASVCWPILRSHARCTVIFVLGGQTSTFTRRSSSVGRPRCLSLQKTLSTAETFMFPASGLGVASAAASDWPSQARLSNAGSLVERAVRTHRGPQASRPIMAIPLSLCWSRPIDCAHANLAALLMREHGTCHAQGLKLRSCRVGSFLVKKPLAGLRYDRNRQ